MNMQVEKKKLAQHINVGKQSYKFLNFTLQLRFENTSREAPETTFLRIIY